MLNVNPSRLELTTYMINMWYEKYNRNFYKQLQAYYLRRM